MRNVRTETRAEPRTGDSQMNEIQVKVIAGRNGRQKAGYRSRMANGLWESAWHHMTVADAKAAIKAGIAHVGCVPDCKVFAHADSDF